MAFRTLFLLFSTVLSLAPAGPFLAAQEEQPAETLWKQRGQLADQLKQQLAPIIERCRQSDLQLAADALSQFVIERDPQRQYIFLPSENPVEVRGLPADLPEPLARQVVSVFDQHAEALFSLARKQVQSKHGAAAYQLLHEALHFAPNHERLRAILGHRKTNDQDEQRWRVHSDRLRLKRATRPQEDFGWPEKSYWIVSTAHFDIESRATEETTRALAVQLERWQQVWRQVFFDYHNRSQNLARYIEGKSKPVISRRKYKVVFFASHDEYVASLKQWVPGIEVSTGFYHDVSRTSYFYASPDSTIIDTWRHELTHQLFQESRQSVKSPFQDEFLWLGEGIAMYFESLTDFGDYVTLGGFDARRLQYARLRRLKEQFNIPLKQLSQLDRSAFQSQAQLAKIYSQSAGIAHYLMNTEYGGMQPSLVEFLRLSYRGRLKKDTFEKVLGRRFEDIDQAYVEFLKIKPQQIKQLTAPSRKRELALMGASLDDDSLGPLADCRELTWLDLSGCDVRGQRLSVLQNCTQLNKLFLNGSVLDSDAAKIIAKLSIRELDCSGSSLGDKELKWIASSPTLTSIHFGSTRVSDASIPVLRGSQNLRVVTITDSKITRPGVATLKSQRPALEVVDE